MELFLGILKYFGLLLVGACSIIGITSDFKVKGKGGKKVISTPGKISILLTILGLVISILSTYFQDKIEDDKKREGKVQQEKLSIVEDYLSTEPFSVDLLIEIGKNEDLIHQLIDSSIMKIDWSINFRSNRQQKEFTLQGLIRSNKTIETTYFIQKELLGLSLDDYRIRQFDTVKSQPDISQDVESWDNEEWNKVARNIKYVDWISLGLEKKNDSTTFLVVPLGALMYEFPPWGKIIDFRTNNFQISLVKRGNMYAANIFNKKNKCWLRVDGKFFLKLNNYDDMGGSDDNSFTNWKNFRQEVLSKAEIK